MAEIIRHNRLTMLARLGRNAIVVSLFLFCDIAAVYCLTSLVDGARQYVCYWLL